MTCSRVGKKSRLGIATTARGNGWEMSTCPAEGAARAVQVRGNERLGAGGGQRAVRRWNLDVDGQCRDRLAAIHPHLDLVGRYRHMAADHCHDLLAQNADQVGLAAERPLV